VAEFIINPGYQKDKHFIIYDASLAYKPEKKAKFINFINLKFLGIGLLLGAFLLIILYFLPILFLETKYHFQKPSPSLPTHSLFGELLWLDKKGIISPSSWEFSLLIPKIALNAKVIPEVDASQETAYKKALKQGVAHAKGSSFPNEDGFVYIFGHSTDFLWNVKTYNALFYLLGKLEPGDEVDLFYQGKHFSYLVSQKKVLDASDLSLLENGKEKQLILSTCWPPGTTLKRLFIIALPKGENSI